MFADLVNRAMKSQTQHDSDACELSEELRKSTWQKTAVMYCVMVAVSTTAIFFLEHATFYNAFRTALVAAIGKTLAAIWISGFFD